MACESRVEYPSVGSVSPTSMSVQERSLEDQDESVRIAVRALGDMRNSRPASSPVSTCKSPRYPPHPDLTTPQHSSPHQMLPPTCSHGSPPSPSSTPPCAHTNRAKPAPAWSRYDITQGPVQYSHPPVRSGDDGIFRQVHLQTRHQPPTNARRVCTSSTRQGECPVSIIHPISHPLSSVDTAPHALTTKSLQHPNAVAGHGKMNQVGRLLLPTKSLRPLLSAVAGRPCSWKPAVSVLPSARRV